MIGASLLMSEKGDDLILPVRLVGQKAMQSDEVVFGYIDPSSKS